MGNCGCADTPGQSLDGYYEQNGFQKSFPKNELSSSKAIQVCDDPNDISKPFDKKVSMSSFNLIKVA